MQPGLGQDSPVHGHLRAVSLEPKVWFAAVFDHALEQHPPGLGALGCEIGAVEHLVANRRCRPIREVSCRREGGAATPGGELRFTIRSQEDPATGVCAESGDRGVFERHAPLG